MNSAAESTIQIGKSCVLWSKLGLILSIDLDTQLYVINPANTLHDNAYPKVSTSAADETGPCNGYG